jgi:hypothetical protein
VNALAGKAIAAVGAVLAFVAIWVDAVPGSSYWNFDGTIAAAGIALAAIAGLLVLGGVVGMDTNGALFAVGATMLGFWGWFPAATAFADWDQTRAGMWLAFAGGALIVIGAGISYVLAVGAPTTPSTMSRASLTAGLGIALFFPGIFVSASSGQSYWDGPLGHSLGIVMLALAVATGLAWAATMMGMGTRGIDLAIALVLLGLMAFVPVGAAFGDFGSLDAGAWLAFAGGILAAGGMWAARGVEMPRLAAAAA